MNLKSLALLVPLAVIPAWAYACGAPQAPPQPLAASVTITASPEPVVSTPPEPSASAAASAQPLTDPAANGESEPPPPHEMTGSAAIVWVRDWDAAGAYRSVWIEPDGAGAKVVAERKEAVFVSSAGLYGIGKKKVPTLVCDDCDLCATAPPRCNKNRKDDMTELFLRGLGKQAAVDPWKGAFASARGCTDQLQDHQVMVEITGGVGPVVFAEVSTSTRKCGSGDLVHHAEAFAWDLEKGVAARIGPPPEQVDSLKKQARADIKASRCFSDENEEPALHRTTARYRPDGRLEVAHVYTMSASFMCGVGLMNYVGISERVSLWLPQELTPYGKVPGWVASFLRKIQSDTAFMVSSKVDEARAQFTKK